MPSQKEKTPAVVDATTGAKDLTEKNELLTTYNPPCEYVKALREGFEDKPFWLKCGLCVFGLWKNGYLEDGETIDETDFVYCMAGPTLWLPVHFNAFCGRFQPRRRNCSNCAWWVSEEEKRYQGYCYAKGPELAEATDIAGTCATWSLRWEPYENARGFQC
jgi:hypothetical protein